MPAYVVLTRESTKDQNELSAYGRMAMATFDGHKMTPVVFYGSHEVLEGAPFEGVVILEFPTVAEAKAWYHSPAYQEAARHRFAGADFRVFIAEGVAAN